MLKTPPAAAQPVASALDVTPPEDCLGTVGGDVGHMLATYVYDWLLGTADREADYAARLEAGQLDGDGLVWVRAARTSADKPG